MAAAGRTGLFRGLPGERGQKNNKVWLSGPKRHFDLAIKGTLTPA